MHYDREAVIVGSLLDYVIALLCIKFKGTNHEATFANDFTHRFY